jgi:RNA polymerase sigma-70 factor (ECF subfamily)
VAASSTSDADFAIVYRQYRGIVQRRALSILGDEQAAKDASQEIFIRALQAQDTFRKEASVTTWIYRITTNYCLNVIRDRARRAEILAAQGPADEAVAPTVDSQIAVSRVLAQLPDQLREIAIYFFVDQMNRDEIAELLGVSRRTIGNRLEEFRNLAKRLTAEGRREVAR